MATKSIKTTKATKKTTAPKMARARKSTEAIALESIAVRAYEIFCARGGEHGHDVEDWLTAERELSC